jgi:enoyl-CoA hydratase
MSISVTTTSALTVVTLNRPRLNLLDRSAIDELTTVFERVDGSPVVLTGAGEAFSAGVDVKAFAQLDQAGKAAFARAITRMTATILAVRGPIVAALPGHAIGGGLVLALCCDYRIAADNPGAKFGLMEAKAGVPFPSGPAEIIRHEVPAPLLRRLALTSAEVSAVDLVAAGVFDEIAKPDDLDSRAQGAAARLAAQPGFNLVKSQIRGGLRDRLAALCAACEEPSFELQPR